MRATANATALSRLHTCATSVTTANEESCARTIITTLLPRAYRRTVTTAEIDEFVALYRAVRTLSTTLTFASGVAAMIEAILQSPDFLYRVEFGTTVPTTPRSSSSPAARSRRGFRTSSGRRCPTRR